MVDFREGKLDNGLRYVLSKDSTTALVAVNLLYELGSKHDPIDKTGLAHFLEHMMFAGTANLPDIDESIQHAGGDNNAFTSQDITNYFGYLPYENLEWILCAEADRMVNLEWNENKYSVQKRVILEEYYETVHKEPYADYWHHLGEMIFDGQPYEWPTIGKNKVHIQGILLEDLKTQYAFLNPSNAILSICGPLDYERDEALVHHVFSGIDKSKELSKFSHYPQLTTSSRIREKTIAKAVPEETVFIAFEIVGRSHSEYTKFELLAEVLSRGASPLLYKHFVKGKEICTDADAWVSDTLDKALFIVELRCEHDVTVDQAKEEFWTFIQSCIHSDELPTLIRRIKNKMETQIVFSEADVLNKALNLAFYKSLNQTEMINKELDRFERITSEDLIQTIKTCLIPKDAYILQYVHEK